MVPALETGLEPQYAPAVLSTRLTQLVVALTVLAFPPALASLAVAPRPAGGLRVTVHLPAAPPQWGR